MLFGISNTCGGVWSNGVVQNMETDKEHDEDCLEGEFQLDSVKFDSGERDRKTIGMGNCSVNIWDGS